MTSMFLDYVAAVVAALKGDQDLVGSVAYIGSVPPDGQYPLIRVEDGGVDEWDTKTSNGINAEITLHVGSRYPGEAQVREIMGKVYSILHNREVPLTAGILVLCQFRSSLIIVDQDGVTRHGVMRFNLLIRE